MKILKNLDEKTRNWKQIENDKKVEKFRQKTNRKWNRKTFKKNSKNRIFFKNLYCKVDEALGTLARELKLTNHEVYGLYNMEDVKHGFIQDYFTKLESKKLKRQEKINALLKVIHTNDLTLKNRKKKQREFVLDVVVLVPFDQVH